MNLHQVKLIICTYAWNCEGFRIKLLLNKWKDDILYKSQTTKYLFIYSTFYTLTSVFKCFENGIFLTIWEKL